MKKTILLLILAAFAAACGTNKTNVTRKSGIDYEKYRNTEIIDVNYTGVEIDMPYENEDFVGSSRYNAKSAYGDAVVTVGSKKFPLGKTAGQKEMRVFQQAIDSAYMTARRAYNPAGFTYTLSPAGSINPLSDMEVQCILSQESADDMGQKTCDMFFKSLRNDYAAALGTEGMR